MWELGILFGYFDFLILSILILLNFKYYGKWDGKTGCWIGAILFGFIVPFISMIIELQLVKARGGWMDNFEVAYVYLRFPVYWSIGIVQCIIIGLGYKKEG